MSHYQNNPAYIEALKKNVKPALGCTEPISLALAAAKAAEYTHQEPIIKIVATVSPNLLKNGMGVTVPGTGMQGLEIAAAVGALCGDASADLEVLKNITPKVVKEAQQLLNDKKVTLSMANTDKALLASVTILTKNHTSKVIIEDAHTNITQIYVNDTIIFNTPATNTNQTNTHNLLKEASIETICQFVNEVTLTDIEFMLAAETINNALSQEGMQHDYGLHIGKTFLRQREHGFLAKDLLSDILIRTTAASDARMGGATLAAMSNCGSGNQGITVSMPVVVVADFLNASKEERIRAQTLAHLVAIYIHATYPALSALCATSTAAMGAAAGMGWLLGKKNYVIINNAICSMIGDTTGMVCDGAANSCAMKVSTSAGSAFKAVMMALDNMRVTGNEGLVSHTVEESIKNLGQLVSLGMKETDKQVIHIMVNKSNC